MFKYSSESDLLTGEIVTPLRKEGNDIICLDKQGNEVKYLISDFDFAKKPEDREILLDDVISQMEDDNKPEVIVVEKEVIVEKPVEVIKEVIVEKEVIKEVPIIQNALTASDLEQARAIKLGVLRKAGLNYNRIDDVTIDIESEIIKEEK